MILVALPAVLVSGAAIAGFFGKWWWALDLLSNFRPQYAVAGAVLGLVLILGKWRKTGAAVMVVALANAALVGQLYLPPSDQPPPGDRTLTVMTFNVDASNESRRAVFDYIGRVRPDVVFLHESTRLWEQAARDAQLGYDIYDVGQPGLIFSTLVLAPPGSEYESFGFATSEPRAVQVVVGEGRDRVTLLGIHPLSPVTRERAALRDAQLGWAADWAKSVEGPAVVAGDFNATPWSHAFRSFLADTGFRDSTRGFGFQPSFPVDNNPVIRVPIDHVLHNDELVVLDRRLGSRVGSDHAPVIVELALAG